MVVKENRNQAQLEGAVEIQDLISTLNYKIGYLSKSPKIHQIFSKF